jgi:hypothetical protein
MFFLRSKITVRPPLGAKTWHYETRWNRLKARIDTFVKFVRFVVEKVLSPREGRLRLCGC